MGFFSPEVHHAYTWNLANVSMKGKIDSKMCADRVSREPQSPSKSDIFPSHGPEVCARLLPDRTRQLR